PLYLEKLARESRKGTEHDATRGETCTHYRERLNKCQAAEGKRTIRRERSFWKKWISPYIGGRPIADVTRDEIETIRDRLDDAVRKRIARGIGHGLGGRSAMNVWSVLRTTFKEAMSHRDRTMRVRTDDPSAGIKPPLTTSRRKRTSSIRMR